MQAGPTFDGLIKELGQEARRSTDGLSGRNDAEILQNLLSLSYPLKAYSVESIRKLVSFGKKAWTEPPADAEFTELLFLLFSKQKISFPSLEIQQEVIGQSVDFLLSTFKRRSTGKEESDVRLAVLRALGTVLFENGPACSKYHSQLMGILVPLSSGQGCEQDAETRRMALNCLGNLCVKTGAKRLNLQKEVYDILLHSLNGDVNEEATCKVVSSALRGLQLLINENKAIVQDSIPTLIPTLQHLGLRSAHSSCSPASAPKKATPPLRKLLSIPSDSEFSDGDLGLPRNRLRDNRLQLNALLCLQALAKSQAKLVYPYWFRFLPDPTAPSSPSLISVMRDSDSPKVRHAACAALMAFLDGSKQYLSVAEESGKQPSKSSFTSLSQKLAEQLKEIHEGLLKAVREDTWPVLLTQELKCLSVLVKNCTYDRLRHDHRCEVYQAVIGRVTAEDFGITSAILECIAALLDAGMPIPLAESEQQFLQSPMVELVLRLTNNSEHISVRVAALDVLCSVARNSTAIFGAYWPRLAEVLPEMIDDAKDAIRAACYKVLEQYAHSCSTAKEGEKTPDLEWWCTFLDTYVQPGTRNEFYAVRSLAVDCLSHIPSDIFQALPPKRQYGCLALALGMVTDDDHTVRAAACRALGVYVAFDSVMEDVLFLSDVATTIPSLICDSNVAVRIRASWALGNLGDALGCVSENAQRDRTTMADAGITDDIIVQIIKAGIEAAKDNDKCRSNGVRALGNMIRVCSERLLIRERERLVKEVVGVVLKNVDSGTVKTRWNACHALTNILRTPSFPLSYASYTDKIFISLTSAVKTCKNFKVRISAATALAAAMTREGYGRKENIINAMRACVDAFESVDRLDEVAFGEFRYREQLVEQLRVSFQHLRSLLADSEMTEELTDLAAKMRGPDGSN